MSSTATPGAGRALARVHDLITSFGYNLAIGFLATIVISFCYEVVSRYFFAAPTEWANPLVAYSLIAMIFLAFPALTRDSMHIAINVFLERASPSRAAMLLRVIRLLAGIGCLFAAWFTANETWNQFNQDIWTSPPFAIPKWLLSMCIPYGMLSSGIYFFRQLVGNAPMPAGDGAAS